MYQEAFVQGISTRKMDKLTKSLGIEGLSRILVSKMTKGLNEQSEAFRKRRLDGIDKDDRVQQQRRQAE